MGTKLPDTARTPEPYEIERPACQFLPGPGALTGSGVSITRSAIPLVLAECNPQRPAGSVSLIKTSVRTLGHRSVASWPLSAQISVERTPCGDGNCLALSLRPARSAR